MTKLKNTKKGMAKKALSISLVAAMLATSNVPVWAAEDLFTDGSSAAVEAPVVEEPAAEVDTFSAEPVEETSNNTALTSEVTDDSYSVTPVINGATDNKVVWDKANTLSATFTLSSKAATVPENIDFYWSWRINGLASDEQEFNANAEVKTSSPTLTASDAGKKLTLYICAKDSKNGDAEVWRYVSDEIEITSLDINDYMDGLTFKNNWDKHVVYNGKQQVPTKDDIDWGAIGTNPDSYDIAVSGDTVNVTDEGVKVTIKAKDGYTGEKVLTYKIQPLEITNNGAGKNTSDHFSATLKTTAFSYTGKTIKIKKSDVTIVDKDHPEVDLSNYLVEDKDGYVGYAAANISASDSSVTGIGYTNFVLNLKETPESGNKNYQVTANTKKVATTNRANVTARNLSTVNVSIASQPIPATGTTISAADILADATFTDKTTKETLQLTDDDVTVEIPSNATAAGNYTVTFTGKAGQNKVTGTVTATLTIVEQDMSSATFSNLKTGRYFADMMYTGDAITLSKDQLGDLMMNGQVISDTLYDVTFEKNTDVGDANVIVTGKGSLAGNKLVFHFSIIPAAVTANDVSSATTVEFIDTTKESDYADSMKVVVKANNATANKEFTLVAGKDYKVTYSFVDENKNSIKGDVGDKVKASVEIINKNFKGSVYNFTTTSNIEAKVLKSEYIKLKESSFTYTGKPVTPAFDVRIDGRIIGTNESTAGRFTYEYSNNLQAGTATLTVYGNGTEYSSKGASVTFKINPASTNDLGGVIASQEYTGYSLDLAEEDFNLTLNGERINVKDNFSLTYGENLNIGEGTVTLTPKNGNFTGTRTFTFQIVGKTLNEGGTFTFYQNGVQVGADDVDGIFTYDGNNKTFDKTVFKYNGNEKLTEGTDYDLVYVDNVYGNKDGKGAVLAVAKGKYGSTKTDSTNGLDKGVYTDAEGNKISNVIAVAYFKIEKLGVYKSNVTVSNGTYAAGLAVKPDVKVIVGGKLLIEGKDYDLDFTGVTDRVNVTSSKSLTVKIVPKNGYVAGSNLENEKFAWGIDKFNFANADVTVDGDNVTVKCGNVVVSSSEYTVAKDASADTVTVTATKDNKNYTGSKTVSAIVENPDEAPAAPVIQSVNVNGNNATVVLAGESDGATGYDYVISKDRDCITSKDYDKVNKNILTTDTTFTYTQQGVYYAYCHAWKRVDGEKVFSDWSAAYPFVVSAITPEQPSITKVEKSSNGKHLRITWTKSANAIGYDVVMGTKLQKVNGEYRPVEYGKAVKKVTNGNTVSVIFYNIPKGTYYVGLHAYNRSSESGVKVFSQWSNSKKVTF